MDMRCFSAGKRHSRPDPKVPETNLDFSRSCGAWKGGVLQWPRRSVPVEIIKVKGGVMELEDLVICKAPVRSLNLFITPMPGESRSLAHPPNG
jgi:hypothetical protein